MSEQMNLDALEALLKDGPGLVTHAAAYCPGRYSDRRDLCGCSMGEFAALRNAAPALIAAARQAAIHEAPCCYCSEPTESHAGDPGRWPVFMTHPDEPGVAKAHHSRCVSERLERVAAFERELNESRFRPLGDNHHNALMCPYCNPERIDPDAAEQRATQADAMVVLSHTAYQAAVSEAASLRAALVEMAIIVGAVQIDGQWYSDLTEEIRRSCAALATPGRGAELLDACRAVCDALGSPDGN